MNHPAHTHTYISLKIRRSFVRLSLHTFQYQLGIPTIPKKWPSKFERAFVGREKPSINLNITERLVSRKSCQFTPTLKIRRRPTFIEKLANKYSSSGQIIPYPWTLIFGRNTPRKLDKNVHRGRKLL